MKDQFKIYFIGGPADGLTKFSEGTPQLYYEFFTPEDFPYDYTALSPSHKIIATRGRYCAMEVKVAQSVYGVRRLVYFWDGPEQ